MKLKAEKRTQTGTNASKKVRAEGKVPAVVYGSQLDTISIAFNQKEFEDTLREVGMNGVFKVEVEGEEYDVFVKDLDHAAVKPILYHVDLLAFTAGEKVTMEIPVYVQGEEEIKEGGYVSQSISEIEMDISPASAPSEISIDVSEMVIGDSVAVSDLDLPKDAEILTEMDATVISISEPDDITEDLETPEGGETEVEEPEVITEKSDDEEASEEE